LARFNGCVWLGKELATMSAPVHLAIP
jgi:hypothetical protein